MAPSLCLRSFSHENTLICFTFLTVNSSSLQKRGQSSGNRGCRISLKNQKKKKKKSLDKEMWVWRFCGKGDMIQRWRILWDSSPDGSCWVTPTPNSVCLQLWLNRLEGRESVWWKETCIPAGRRTSEEPGHAKVNETGRTRRRARRVSPLIAHRKDFVYPARETQTSSPCSLGGQRSGQVKIMRLMRTIGLQTFSCIANICGSGVRNLYCFTISVTEFKSSPIQRDDAFTTFDPHICIKVKRKKKKNCWQFNCLPGDSTLFCWVFLFELEIQN